MSAAVLSVEQNLVDQYLARVERFCSNVEQFSQTLKDMTTGLRDRFMPEAPVAEAPVYQEAATMAAQQPAQADVVTADDVDIDALLRDLNLGSGLSM